MSKFHKTAEWKRTVRAYRAECLRADTWYCAECGCDGRYIRLEIDHIEPLSAGGLAYASSNLQPLCAACHVAKSRLEREKPCPERLKWIELLGF
ncbi:MAG: HNH endonuclease [Boseongicola sp. SB0673_bin_14]|nr:HNH endonuclease [Boseongicola sp. SB0673_bin_14]